ncbi:MAG: hypothetical protein ACRDRX_24360 [Pseudonocardiaceae bacterium]
MSEFVESMTTAITRRANKYVEMLDESRSQGTLRADEPELLNTFENYAADVLERYVPPGPRRRDSLVFTHLYSTVADPSPEDRTRLLITALLAAETEFRGPLRLTQDQNSRLARILQGIGAGFMADRLPSHAALAFDRAAGLYLQVGDHRNRDQCLLARSRARHRARDRGGIKVLETISAVLCGYGYQPYRLLGWVVVQLAGFSLVLALISPESVINSLYMCLINFLNPLGVGDTQGMPRSSWILLIVEGYAGAVSLSIFFALLVRRWFRV